MVASPLSLHLANMISSDGLFLALSMTWFALLLWIIYKPSNKIFFWHAIVVFAAFTVRYNALIYPFIAAVAFGLSKQTLRKKIFGWGLSLALIAWFMGISIYQYKKLTGYWQFSPFSGWQLANNAMYAYQEVDSADREPVAPEFQALDNIVRNFYDRNPTNPAGVASTSYMWTEWYPLMQYTNKVFKAKDSTTPQLKEWASMGPFFTSYGWHIIKKYPMHFIRYFILPNSLKYLAPPVEFFEYYNWNRKHVREPARIWFGYKSYRIKTRMKSNETWVLTPYPYFICIINITMLLMLLTYLLLKGWQTNTTFNKSILLAGFTWLTNAAFTIFAASAALRFQAFPALLTLTFSLLLIDWMTQFIEHIKLQTPQQNTESQYSHNVSA
jgi:hypothetical protein